VNPAPNASSSSATPMTQLSSRGRRNAPGEEHPEHVHDDRGDEHQRRPVVDLTHQETRADLERQAQDDSYAAVISRPCSGTYGPS
jgi:hypothetical protein